MSSDPGDFPGRSQYQGRRPPAGAQGASRGGFRPSDPDDDADSASYDNRSYGNASDDRGYGGSSGGGGNRGGRGGGGSDKKFLGLPVNLIYALGGAIILIVIVGAVCGRPTATGTVSGQIKALNADRSVATLPGAQVVLKGSSQTYTATSTDVPANAEGEAAYNYRIENVPPGNYTMAVTPPAGSTLQPEQDISFKVESGQLFPQSVMLLAQGIQKPRALAPNELQPGEAGGYVNDRGERIVYQQGGGFDATDALLLYLLWRNPGGYGYGYPPVIVNSPGGTSGYNYRVADPPTQSRSGQTVTQRKPETPGQGSTRPSSSTGAGPATGSGPTYSSGTGSSGSSSSGSGSGSSTSTKPSTSSGSSSGSSTSTQTKPSTSSGSGSSVSVPSQGASRPSSSTTSPSRSSSSPSRSSGSSSSGGRR